MEEQIKEKKLLIETDRLSLRPFELSDAGFILKLLNSQGWLEYIGDRQVRTEEDAKMYLLNGPIKSCQVNGYGLSLVSLKDENIPIGACGLLKRDYLDDADIGFAFLPEYIGKGYGFESASAVMTFAKKELNITHILAFTVPHNIASIKLLEKLGLHFEKNFCMPGEEEELSLFSNQ